MSLSETDVQKMKDLYQEKDSTYTSIGKVFGLSRKVVARVLKSEGVEPKDTTPVKAEGEVKPPEAPQTEINVESKKEKKKKGTFNNSGLSEVNKKKYDANVKVKQNLSLFLARSISDASPEFRKSLKNNYEIEFVGVSKGEFTGTCAFDASFETIHFFKSHHEMINWYRDHVKAALDGGWEDELHLIELYLDGERLHPRFEMHVTLPLNKKVQQSLIFEHAYNK